MELYPYQESMSVNGFSWVSLNEHELCTQYVLCDYESVEANC